MSTFQELSQETSEALISQVLENQHLYAQNAAMRHGVPEPPRRVKSRQTSRSVKVDQPQQTQPQVVVQQPPVSPQPVSPPEKPNAWKEWGIPALVGSVLGLATLAGGYFFMPDETSSVESTNKTLLEFLEDEGLTPRS